MSDHHTDFWFIHSAYDFESNDCHLVESFYDCFSGVEKIINHKRWPDFVIDGAPGEPKNLMIKKTVSYAGKFYITHVIENEAGINMYSNKWQSWIFNIKDDDGNVPAPAPSPYPEPTPPPVDPTPAPVPEPEPAHPYDWPSGGWPDVKRPDRPEPTPTPEPSDPTPSDDPEPPVIPQPTSYDWTDYEL